MPYINCKCCINENRSLEYEVIVTLNNSKTLDNSKYMLYSRLAPVLKTFFHPSVISYTFSQSNSDGSVLKHILVASLTLMALFKNRAIRVRLATSI